MLEKIHRFRKFMFITNKEKREVMDMIYKYKEAFSLRDEIGTFSNIEVEIDITDKSHSFKSLCRFLILLYYF